MRTINLGATKNLINNIISFHDDVDVKTGNPSAVTVVPRKHIKPYLKLKKALGEFLTFGYYTDPAPDGSREAIWKKAVDMTPEEQGKVTLQKFDDGAMEITPEMLPVLRHMVEQRKYLPGNTVVEAVEELERALRAEEA